MLQVVLAWMAAWLLAALLLQYARRAAAARRYWADRGIPHLPPCPIFGTLRDAVLQRTTPEEILAELYNKFPNEPVVGFWRMQSPSLLVRDPSLARTMFIADFVSFSHRGVKVDERADPLTAHLINLSGARWRHLRARLTAFSSTGRLRAMVPAITKCAIAAEAVLREYKGRPVPTNDVMARYTTDVIGACVYGLEFSALEAPEGSRLRSYGRRAALICFSANVRRIVRLMLPRLAHALRLRQFPADICDFFRGLVTSEMDRRERLMEENMREEKQRSRRRVDFMELLTEIRQDMRNSNTVMPKESGDDNLKGISSEREDWRSAARPIKKGGDVAVEDAALTEDLLVAQAFMWFLAGFESPSNTATYCLYELARHPRVQKAAREDVMRALAAHPPPDGAPVAEAVSYEALQDMTYLDMVILETLRRYPSTGLLFRECDHEYQVPDSSLTLEPGTMVFINIFAMHHDPQYFSDPHLFLPERFSPEERGNIKPYTYLPFGLGPRTCVGERFSYLQIKSVLAQILMRLEVQPCSDTPEKLLFDPRAFGLRSVRPITLRFLPLPSPTSASVAPMH